jgi:hypothetical protein
MGAQNRYTDFVIDAAGKIALGMHGNVGVGTSDPETKLDINGKASVNNPAGISADLNTGSAGVTAWNGANRRLELRSNGTFNDLETAGAALTINHFGNENVYMCAGGGRVGIGTTNPMASLDLSGSLAIGGDIVVNATGEWVGDPTGLVGPKGDKGDKGDIQVRRVLQDLREIKEIQAPRDPREIKEIREIRACRDRICR